MKKDITLSTSLIDKENNAIAVNIYGDDGEVERFIEAGPVGVGNHIAVALDELMEMNIPIGKKIRVQIEIEE